MPDKTFYAAIARNGDVMVGSYDHYTQKYRVSTLHPALEVDDHAAPSILIRTDGRLIVFYSKHNGDTIYYRISTNPLDISSWQTEQTIVLGTYVSYLVPIYLSSENKIYVFFRYPGTSSWSFITSTDNGASWSSDTELIEIAGGTNQYLKISSNGLNRIDFAHSGHPDQEVGVSIYHFYYQGGSYYKTDGTLITSSLPLNRSDMTLVYDGSTVESWIWDCVLYGGIPFIVFATLVTSADHRYRYAKWNGSSWDHYEITSAGGYIDGVEQPSYSGGIVLDPENPNVVYLSKVISSQWEIQKGITANGGATWDFTNITSGSSKKNIRPVVPKNHHSNLPILWLFGDYTSYTGFDTKVVPYFI